MAKWIQLESGFFRHRKTLRLRRAIGADALWIPARLWCYCSDHESDDISGLSPEDLKDVLEYPGDAAGLVEALKAAEFVSADGKTVEGWRERYGAKLAFYQNRARKAAEARWGNGATLDESRPQNTNTRLDKIRKHREASTKHASSMLQASAGAVGVSRFTIPTPEEVTAYGLEIGYPIDGAAWCDSYAQKGWMVGKAKMKDWKAAVRNWKANGWLPNGGSAGRPHAPEATVRRVDLTDESAA